MQRRSFLASASASLGAIALPASAASPATSLSIQEQIQDHVEALMALLESCALPDFPKVQTAFILGESGRWTVGGVAFGRGEFKSGGLVARFVDSERWEVQ
jgi:hypothetical protein